MPSAVTGLLAAIILIGPPLAVVGLVLWARRQSRHGTPRVVVWVAYLLATLVGLILVAGYLGAVVVAMHAGNGEAVEPSTKARALAEAISETMNCGAFALLVAAVGGAGLGLWRWRRGREGRNG